ncbi:tRNA (N6-threonylcarbamoyladenosine(37)-N6)-methyltransferase TrmO [Salinimonas sp. HHU 13199]|uniref:tRNA (N6-threonylcarbamoyladenosine(37)-N6)-methyltransferase TrmO n=1 Tax=Salinimonas profundi TaxID=2729140 RepID=A0ABR8LSZ1_9ALTE|nr:tRNA (N6-threonylcarbamoyladenosine(37)-N6)-methyltransferase TrmO [Salinimonas profundi]MBD3587270.1 tRNA (N6-threonylcarbamoyladenosine(37)-N6)-methyltransferase TrmO [Salinimonas profundi]
MNSGYCISPIATISTPFKQKFAIPRQPNLADAKGKITLANDFDDPRSFKGLENYSHLWLLFIFHETAARGWKPAVKAPRLGGNATLGVFASRSTHRPNSIGMSVVKNRGVSQSDGHLQLHVSGVDLLDGTPIIDIKPYIRYADSIDGARDNLDAYAPIPRRPVCFCPTARDQLIPVMKKHPDAADLIEAVLHQDPRPAYRQSTENDDKIYKVKLYDFDVSWQVKNGQIEVLSLL